MNQPATDAPDNLDLTSLDWILVILALIIIAGLWYPALLEPDLWKVQDSCRPGVAIMVGFGALLALLPALFPRRFMVAGVGWRRFWIGLAFLGGLIGACVIYPGLYYGIFWLLPRLVR